MRLCLDIGGMSVKAAVFSGTKIVYRKNVVYGKIIDNVELLKIINNLITEITSLYREISDIGISSPGVIDVATTQVHGFAAITNINKINYRRDLNTDLPIFVENDAYAVGQSQIAFNKKIRDKTALIFIIGSGLGGAMIINNKIHKGATSLGGNFGFIVHNLDLKNPRIGNTTSTTTVLIKNYLEKTGTHLTGKEIVEGYYEDEAKKNAVNDFIDELAINVLTANAIAAADIVLLGGGISQSKLILELLTKKLDNCLNLVGEPYTRKFKVEQCLYAQDANLYGALVLKE
ncbi:ROK family protein [Mesoplasma syrphidae]|uniref:ROK family protein n=1 Tax=Mesoplasma syrphidae TaxID=225999 RepID=A0A2K9C4J7_9MOLU|nr:ROK family protein [Mesoplasma syrphidae]AUF83207.1 ROK family protein [Mesoplasma syrphidae]